MLNIRLNFTPCEADSLHAILNLPAFLFVVVVVSVGCFHPHGLNVANTFRNWKGSRVENGECGNLVLNSTEKSDLKLLLYSRHFSSAPLSLFLSAWPTILKQQTIITILLLLLKVPRPLVPISCVLLPCFRQKCKFALQLHHHQTSFLPVQVYDGRRGETTRRSKHVLIAGQVVKI